jgi:hypothetical protein
MNLHGMGAAVVIVGALFTHFELGPLTGTVMLWFVN